MSLTHKRKVADREKNTNKREKTFLSFLCLVAIFRIAEIFSDKKVAKKNCTVQHIHITVTRDEKKNFFRFDQER
jgi:hypothetical protein